VVAGAFAKSFKLDDVAKQLIEDYDIGL